MTHALDRRPRRAAALERIGLCAAAALLLAAPTPAAVADADGDRAGEHAEARHDANREGERHDGQRDRESEHEREQRADGGGGDRAGEDREARGDRDRRRETGERERPRPLRSDRERFERRGPAGIMEDGPFDGQRQRGRWDATPLDEADREAALAVLADVHPRLAGRLNQARENNPRRADRVLRKMWPRLRRLVELREQDPAMYRLRVADQRHKVETLRLVRQLRHAQREGENPQRIRALQTRLRQQANEHFEIRQRMRQRELEQLAERIEQLRTELQQRQANRRELIGRYLDALLDHDRDHQNHREEGDRPPGPDQAEE